MTAKLTTTAALLLAGLALPVGALAQQAAPAPAPATPEASPSPGASRSPEASQSRSTATLSEQVVTKRVDQHINQLHSELRITPAQQAQWDQFAQVMRDNARDMDRLLEQRGARLASMTAAENMQSYAQVADQHAHDMQQLASAFQALYGSMSEHQKQNADMVFRGRLGHPHHGRG